MNGFCWQQVGLDRLNPSGPLPSDTGDPTLNIDPTRSGVEPDIAFTGPNDTVAWVVWYEEDPTQIDGLRSNDMVFAAKIVADGTADGGFQLGRRRQRDGRPDQRPRHLGCARFRQLRREPGCRGRVRAQRGRHAATRRTRASPPARSSRAARPCRGCVWQEDVGGGTHAIFVSRLVGGDHFELFNSGQPVSNTTNDATRPDITFSGNVPYISWHENVSGAEVTFVGHFEGGASAPAFKLDTPTGIPNSAFGPNVADPLRAPISSGCTANPTNADGASCQGGAIGTPFVLYTAGRPGRPAALRPGIRADRRVDARRHRHHRDGCDAERIGESRRRCHPDPLRLRRDDGLRHQHGGRSSRRRERRDRLRRDGERAHAMARRSISGPSRRPTSSPSTAPTRASRHRRLSPRRRRNRAPRPLPPRSRPRRPPPSPRPRPRRWRQRRLNPASIGRAGSTPRPAG